MIIQALVTVSVASLSFLSIVRTSSCPATNTFENGQTAKTCGMFASVTHLTTHLSFILYVVLNVVVYAKTVTNREYRNFRMTSAA